MSFSKSQKLWDHVVVGSGGAARNRGDTIDPWWLVADARDVNGVEATVRKVDVVDSF